MKAKPPIPFLNPDLIAAGFGPADPEKSSFQAGRVLLTDIKNKIQKGESFAFESTLSGLTYAALLQEAKNQGYQIIIYFVFLNKMKLNLARIQTRVLQGGHDIPSHTVRRRHLRCFENFWNIYRPIAEEWSLLDNSNSRPKFILNSELFEAYNEKQKSMFVQKFLKGKL